MDLYTRAFASATGFLAHIRLIWHRLFFYNGKKDAVPPVPPVPCDHNETGIPNPHSPPDPALLGLESPEIRGTNAESTLALPAPEPEKSADPSVTGVTAPMANRAERRRAAAWERARRKADKFVEPQGPTPIPIPRGKRGTAVAALPAAPPLPDDNILIQDEDGTCYRESELYGEFSFRDTILDQLDRYWIYLERMKKHDSDSYEFYKKLGATVVPPIHWFMHKGLKHKEKIFDKDKKRPIVLHPLSPWWKANRPTFGCVTFGIGTQIEQDELEIRDEGHENQRMWIPKFLYFTKYKTPPPNVQPTTNGDVYAMTVWWDRPHDPDPKFADRHKSGVPEQYAVYVSADGNDVHVLPQCQTDFVPIRRKKPYHGFKRGKTFTIPHRHWAIPGHYTAWAKYHNTTPNILLTSIFLNAATSLEQAAYSMVRVAVHKENLTAVFGVDIKRLPYFFQDRDITLTERGSRKRAFHIVRPHVRKDGTPVKTAFRGEREFTWAGYQVKITIPGRDHFLMAEFDVGVEDLEEVDKKELEKYADMKKLAEVLDQQMERGMGGIKK